MVPTPECPYVSSSRFWERPPFAENPFDRRQLNPILLGQSRTQGIIRNHLKRLGREVELGTELVDIEQNADYATCRLRKTNGDGSVEDETLKVDYVVGADGGRGLWNGRAVRFEAHSIHDSQGSFGRRWASLSLERPDMENTGLLRT